MLLIDDFKAIRIVGENGNLGRLVVFHALNELVGPDFARGDKRNSRRIDHDLLLGDFSTAFFKRNDLASGVEGDARTGKKEWEGRVKVMIWISDLLVVMLLGDFL